MTQQKSPSQAKEAAVPPLVLRLRPVIDLSDDQLLELSSLNSDLRLELTAEGGLVVMPPIGGETSSRNSNLNYQLTGWTLQDGTGVAFDSNGGFVLPNGAVRAPDAAWVRRERLAGLSAEQKRKFLTLCPDFVVELRSPSDPLETVQAKMVEYVENGARLGWLLDPDTKRVHVYKPGKSVRTLENPKEVSGDPVLPGFVLGLGPVWEPGF